MTVTSDLRGVAKESIREGHADNVRTDTVAQGQPAGGGSYRAGARVVSGVAIADGGLRSEDDRDVHRRVWKRRVRGSPDRAGQLYAVDVGASIVGLATVRWVDVRA